MASYNNLYGYIVTVYLLRVSVGGGIQCLAQVLIKGTIYNSTLLYT